MIRWVSKHPEDDEENWSNSFSPLRDTVIEQVRLRRWVRVVECRVLSLSLENPGTHFEAWSILSQLD